MHLNVTLLQEIGVNWSKVPNNQRWKERTATQLDPHQTQSYMSYNRHNKTGQALQWGGTGIMSYGRMAHHGNGAGSNKAQLGRWTWARYTGKDGVVLRCVSVYRPCNDGEGSLTVAAQHREYFSSKGQDRLPRTAFLDDLSTELAQWIEQGDQIILGGDLNAIITSAEVSEFFAPFGMVNVLAERHSLNHAQGPI